MTTSNRSTWAMVIATTAQPSLLLETMTEDESAMERLKTWQKQGKKRTFEVDHFEPRWHEYRKRFECVGIHVQYLGKYGQDSGKGGCFEMLTQAVDWAIGRMERTT